jgi:hypothetical protein
LPDFTPAPQRYKSFHDFKEHCLRGTSVLCLIKQFFTMARMYNRFPV